MSGVDSRDRVAYEALESAARVLVTGGQGGVGELQRNFEQLGIALERLDQLKRGSKK